MTASHGDGMDTWKEEQLNLMFSRQSPESLFDAIVAMTGHMGFDHCAYGVRVPLPFAQPQILMFNNYSRTWQARYQDKGYLAIDPTVRHGLVSLDAYSWPDHAPSDEHEEFWAEAHAHGLRDGISLPVLTVNGIRGMFTVTRSTADSDPHSAAKLDWLSHVVHQSMSHAVVRESFDAHKGLLTNRELEVLKWTADGKTSAEISEAVGITERTVNFHINSAIAKLGVPNRTAAAVRAVVLGLIT